MLRPPFSKLASCFAWSLLLPAVASAEPPKSLGQPEGEVSIIAWPGYLERGATDKAYDWVTPFEKSSGCKVTVKTAGTSDEMVQLMNQGGYDLVTASGDASLRLIAGKKVQELNPALVPSWNKIDPRITNAPWHTIDGHHYGVPYQWGPNVLLYSTKVWKTPPQSWAVVFDTDKFPDGKASKGRIQAYDGPIYIADAALYLMAKEPGLGIKDPYELAEPQYKAALEVLRKQKQNLHRYWHDANVQVQDFTSEGIVASSSWPFQVNTLKGNKQPVASTVPKEGSTGWADTTMLAAQAKHPVCAYKWLDWSLQPKVQGDVSAWFGSLPANPEGCKASELLGKEGCKNNGWEQFDRIRFWRTPTAKCASQNSCVPYSRWAQDYIAIMGGR
jgi:putative spermidine/putrescine transport system substrate-binding protein